MTSKRIASLLAALALGGVMSSQAQGRDTTRAGMQHRMPGMTGGRQAAQSDSMPGMCGVMMAMHEGPDAALTHAEHINLTDAQRTRLEAARARVQSAHRAAMERAQAADRALATATRADRVNENAIRLAIRGMADAHAQAAVAVLRAREDTRNTLTPEQRAQLAQYTSGDDSMMGGRMPMGRDSMGMQGRPMMGDSGMAGHMPMMGMMGMMMGRCGGMKSAADSSGAHRH